MSVTNVIFFGVLGTEGTKDATGWMQRDCWHGMHVRLCDVLDDDGDIEIPCSNRLVIGGGHESAILVDKGDRIDRPQMLVILLRYLSGIDIVLEFGLN